MSDETDETRDWNVGRDVFYRLYLSASGPTVVCMQWFDEGDYDEPNFLDDNKYEYEQDAWTALARICPEELDWRTVDSESRGYVWRALRDPEAPFKGRVYGEYGEYS